MEISDKSPQHIEKNILDLFWNLTKKNASIRINTCIRILRFVDVKQKSDEQNHELTLKYCIERLVKGLSSSRDAARLGFALLLTEILKQTTTVEIEEVLNLAKQHLSFTPNQEKKDIVFGQLFVYSSIIRSGRLVHHSHLSFVTLALYDLWQSRTYVLNACYEILKDLFSQLSPENFKENLWPHLRKKFSSGWEECSPDNLWLLLMASRIYPNAVNEKYFQKHWNTSNIFSAENFDNLKKLVRQTTSSLPKLHPLSAEIAIICFSEKGMKEIWSNVVDENLFEGDHMEKSFVGFEMIKCALQFAAKKKFVKHILAPKFSTVFAKSFLNMKSYLNPAASQLADYLSSFAIESNNPDVQLLVLKFFLQLPTMTPVDQILKKKAVSLLIQNLLPEAVKLYFEFLKKAVISKTSSSESEVDNKIGSKKYVFIAQIGALVFHPKVMTDIEWRIHVIKFLLLNSFFALKKTTPDILHCEEEIEEMSSNIRISFTNAFFKTLTSLYQRVEQMTPLQQSLQCLLLLVDYADQLLTASENICPQFPVEKVLESWQQMKNIVHKLKKQSKKDGNVNESNAFLALFLEFGFHLFHDFEHTSEVLEELYICCKKALHNRKNPDEQQEDTNEPPWISVVTDIMLSLLSRPSQHLRRLVTSVFQLLCPFINQDALQQILTVINPESSKDEPMLVEESDEDENVEFESGSSSEESDSDASEEANVDENFKQKLKDALGSAADASDEESIILSDSEMFKLDDALSKAFREQKQTGPNQMKSEEKSLLNFRVRALDLVMTYLKSDPPMYLVLQCIEPILAAFEYGHHNEQQKHLLHKSVSVLETITKIKKFKHLDNVEKSELKKLLEILVAKCHKEVNMKIAKKLYSLSVFIVLCFRRLESHKSPQKTPKKCPFYMKVYLSALEVFATGNSSNMFPQFFVSFMEACPDLAWELIEPSKDYAFNNNIRIYRRTQCLGLLFESLKFSKGQTSINNDQWTELGKVLIPKAVETLKVIIGESESKPSYLTELLDVIFTSHSILKEKTNQSILQEYSDILPLLSNLPKQHEKKLTKKGRSAKNKIIISLGGSIEQGKKKKSLNDDNAVTSENAVNNDNADESNIEHFDHSESTLNDSAHKKRKSTSKGSKKTKKQKTKNSEIVNNC